VHLNTTSGAETTSNWNGSMLRWSCTSPLPPGTGNLASDPQFVNAASGDFHLQPTSRCINAGTNASVFVAADLDGNPRIMGGTVDMGVYEIQASVTGTFASWLQQHGLAADGSADFTDADGDGAGNWQEWWAGTDPTNSASALHIVQVAAGTTGLDVVWESVATRNYWVDRAADVAGASPFQTIVTNLPGAATMTIFHDTTATGDAPYFYRIGVK
jgi:hypothetical protein